MSENQFVVSFPAAASADVNVLTPACSSRPLASMPDSLTRTKQSTGMLLSISILDVVVEDADVLLLFSPYPHILLHSWQNYVDYHKCVNAKGEEFTPCQQFKRAYRSLCPNEWAAKWDEQIENGTFPASLKP